jgi:transposase InsO family protein
MVVLVGDVGRSAYYGGCPCRSVAAGQSPTSPADSRQDPLSGHRFAIPCRAAERWHQTTKNRGLLENYFLPGDLERQIGAFVEHYNNHRYHESLQNLTPADVYFGRGQTILRQRERIKQKTIETRRLLHRKSAA